MMTETAQGILIGILIVGLFMLFLWWWKQPKGKMSKRIEKMWLRFLLFIGKRKRTRDNLHRK